MKNFTFIDLFAGLGGFRLALESLGGKCVFSSEINPHACAIYEKNFGDNPYQDIITLDPHTLPDFTVLCAGFPCQAFSIAGKKQGFKDTRGTLFFDVCRIISEKKPPVVLLENVKNLVKHDNGKTFTTIISSLEELHYNVSFKILNAKDFSTAQSRERIIIVGIHKDFSDKAFQFNLKSYPSVTIKDILENQHSHLEESEYTIIDKNCQKIQKSGLIFSGYRNKNIRKVGVNPNTLHLSRVHKQPNRIYHINGVHPTLSSKESSGRYFVYNGNTVFKLNLLECFRLMGFDDNYVKFGSQVNLYNRIGNSICIPMIKEVMSSIIEQGFI